MSDLTCFKAYDIRGEIGVNIDEDIAYRIGRAVAQHFNSKSVVIGFDARDTSPAFAAVASQGARDAGDVVVNQAAVHRDDVRDKSEYQRTNVDGAENVAQVCSEKGIKKIVFTSTVAVYGFAEPGTNESGKINPFNEYGRTKFEAEEKLRSWQEASDNSLLIVRPTVIFGEGRASYPQPTIALRRLKAPRDGRLLKPHQTAYQPKGLWSQVDESSVAGQDQTKYLNRTYIAHFLTLD